jgi:endonuclease YncB( thermonuclease family)
MQHSTFQKPVPNLNDLCFLGRNNTTRHFITADTINALILGKQQIRVRLAFVDAPEKGQAFGQRAKAAMSELGFGKDVKLRPQTIDRNGRLIARVIIDNQDAGLELLKRGLCWVYEKYVSEAPPEIQTSYWAAQSAAQSDKLWVVAGSGPDAAVGMEKKRKRTSENGARPNLSQARGFYQGLARQHTEPNQLREGRTAMVAQRHSAASDRQA